MKGDGKFWLWLEAGGYDAVCVCGCGSCICEYSRER